MNRRALSIVPIVLLIVTAAEARAQVGEPLTRGIDVPTTPVAGDFDAFAVEANPAGIGTLDEYSLTAAHVQMERSGRRPGAGDGVFFAKPVTLPFLTRFAYGAALQYLRAPRSFIPNNDQAVKLSFALSYQLGTAVWLGGTWSRMIADQRPELDGVDTFSAGIVARAAPYLAFGLTVHDLNTPLVAGVPEQRRYDGEVLLRPLGTAALEIAGGVRLGERRGDVSPRARLDWSPVPGATLRAQVDLAAYNAPVALGTDERHEVRAVAALELSLGRAAAGLASFFGQGPGSDWGYHGTGLWLRFSGEKYPALFAEPRHIERFHLEGDMGGERAFTRILTRMRRLERDDKVVAIAIRIDELSAGWAKLQELRRGIERLKQAGKPVLSYVVAGTTRDYYVASAASRVLLDAGGGLRLVGLSSTLIFFKGLFDKVGVKADFVKIAEYKSAPEAFTRDSSSTEAAAMKNAILDSIYGQLVTDIAHDRGLTPDVVKQIFDQGPYTPPEALKAKLVDVVANGDELDRMMAKQLGQYYPVMDADPTSIKRKTWQLPQIAVIYVDGDIIDGKSKTIPLLGETLVGGDTLSAAITWARENPRIEAIVLRVNSPGGSALASELMAREIARTRGVKPVICSMGDVAASGGYFVSAPCDRIFAMPGTVTGSIGIFTGKFDVSGLAQLIGLTWEIAKRGAHADEENIFRMYTDEERKDLLHKLRYYYERFTGTVAAGRKLTMAEVDKIGRGHVWTGEQAMPIHLIDEYGSISDAIVYAKQKAGLGVTEPTELVMLPADEKDFLSTLIGLFTGADEHAGADAMLRIMPSAVELLRAAPIALMHAPDSPQARLPFHLQLR